MPTAEILTVALKPGSDIGDPNNEAAKVLKEVTDELNQTPGVQRVDFGMQVEEPTHFQFVVTWDKIDSHKAFMATEAYKPFLQRFLSITDGPPTLFHADLEPHGDAMKAFNAPVTEFATFYFGAEPPEGYLDGVHKFREAASKQNVDGMHTSAAGLTYEEIEREGVKGKGAVLVVGYDSVDAHMAFRELDVFKQNVSALRAGVQKADVHHAQLLKVAATQ